LLAHRHGVRALLIIATLAAGCRSGNRPDLNADAAISNICQVAKCTPDPNGVCQHTCTPDPGPQLVNCARAEESIEFGPVLWTFDPPESMGNARGMYSYTDNSNIIQTYQTPPDPQMPDEMGRPQRSPKTWEPPTATLPRCADRPNPNNQAIHIQGGPFLSWGGGTGIGMKNYPSVVSSVTINNLQDAMLDVSEWEGISFWARRGPDSQAGMRVLVGDKYTDDDISYLMYRDDPTVPRFCERVRECACLNHKTCEVTDTKTVSAACDQGRGQPTMDCCGGKCEVINGAESPQAGGSQCTTCRQTRCDERWPAYPDDYATPGGTVLPGSDIPQGSDRQFYGKPCTPYTMRNGISSSWCFDPAAGERPAEPPEQCGDHWTSVVNLSNEWQFYTVPFNNMRQQGWAKRQAMLDLTSVSVVRFTWDGGWIDYWIDDVKFYKRKKTP